MFFYNLGQLSVSVSLQYKYNKIVLYTHIQLVSVSWSQLIFYKDE